MKKRKTKEGEKGVTWHLTTKGTFLGLFIRWIRSIPFLPKRSSCNITSTLAKTNYAILTTMRLPPLFTFPPMEQHPCPLITWYWIAAHYELKLEMGWEHSVYKCFRILVSLCLLDWKKIFRGKYDFACRIWWDQQADVSITTVALSVLWVFIMTTQQNVKNRQASYLASC